MPRFGHLPPPAAGDRALFGLLRSLAAVAGTLGILALLLYTGYLGYTDIDPPGVEMPPQGPPVVEAVGRRIRLPSGRLERDGHLWVLDLSGGPEAMGAAAGNLAARGFLDLHDHVLARLRRRYPAASEAWGANMLLRWRYRGGDRHVPEPYRRELAAMAAALPEAATGRYTAYHVLFLYQVFPDLAKHLDDVVFEGFAFAVRPRGRSREAGNLVVGRMFDVDLGYDYEPDRIVSFVHPDGKYPFASVGWPGLLGVVTGVNARGLFVAVDGARTDDPPADGVPLPLLARTILEDADGVDRALEILHDAKVRTAGALLLADGGTGRALVVELAPRSTEERRVVRGENETTLFMTNHLVADVFKPDPYNDRIRRDTSSGPRYDRLAEILAGRRRLTPEEAAKVLRDRRGRGGEDIGLGNRNALEPLHGTHAVIVDLTAMALWVCEGPSALGTFRAYDLRTRLGRPRPVPPTLPEIPPDPLLFSAQYDDYRQALEEMAFARRMMAAGRLERARTAAHVAAALAPELGELYRLMGDIERMLGNDGKAREHYERYLALSPGRLRDHERVRSILAELAGS